MIAVGEGFLARGVFVSRSGYSGRSRDLGIAYVIVVMAYALSALSWWWLTSSMGSLPGRMGQVRRALRVLALESRLFAVGLVWVFVGYNGVAPGDFTTGVVIRGAGSIVVGIGFWMMGLAFSKKSDLATLATA